MQLNEFDIVVLGGGTGGYAAAVRAHQLGMKAAIAEKDKIGGTCLHRGCIPNNIAINFIKMQERKNQIVDQLYKGVLQLLKKNRVTMFRGEGRILGPSIFSPQPGAIAVTRDDGESENLIPKHLLIATGSRPRPLPGMQVDGVYVLTSDEALQQETLPKDVLIIGGGAIGGNGLLYGTI